MSTMPAVVKTARGDGNVALRELPQPRPGPGQVLLAVRAAGICGTDLHIYHDEFRTEPPVVLGHELAGEVVAGPGAIGLLTLQVARAAGAAAIVLGTAADRHRLALAQELGAARVVDVDDEDPMPIVRALTGGWGADVVFECSGAGPAALSLLDHARRGGQYAQIGLFGKSVAWDLDQVCMKELRVTGSNASVPSAWRIALRLLTDGSVQTAPLISDIYPLADWEEAFQRFEQRDGVKLLLHPG